MALYENLKPFETLPDLKGHLPASVNPSSIKNANKAVKNATFATAEQQAAVNESQHGKHVWQHTGTFFWKLKDEKFLLKASQSLI